MTTTSPSQKAIYPSQDLSQDFVFSPHGESNEGRACETVNKKPMCGPLPNNFDEVLEEVYKTALAKCLSESQFKQTFISKTEGETNQSFSTPESKQQETEPMQQKIEPAQTEPHVCVINATKIIMKKREQGIALALDHARA